MGCQVALETCLLYPDRCDALALFNGTSGQALQTGLQPAFKFPYFGDILSLVVSYVLKENGMKWYSWILECARALLFKPITTLLIRLYCMTFGSQTLTKLLGPMYMQDFWSNYLGQIYANHKTMTNFLRGFQELDAHRCDHILWQVRCPVLMVAGLWDVFTPAWCMVRMAALLEGPNRLVVDMASSHATLLENPERALGELQHFMATMVPRYERVTSTHFQKLTTDKIASTSELLE